MATFLKELWQNIFEPGTTPALVKATHAAFTGLLLTIIAMLYVTRSLHFVALLILSVGLWAGVTWFIAEYNKVLAQKGNLKVEGEGKKLSTAPKSLTPATPAATTHVTEATATATTVKSTKKKRRV